MSSGSSVFSIIPPKRARTERFILVQSPITAHPPPSKCEIPNDISSLLVPFSAIYVVLMYDPYAQVVSILAKTDFEYISSIKTLPQNALRRRGPSDVASELHSRPM